MTTFESLLTVFEREVLPAFREHPAYRFIFSDQMSVAHYRSAMLEFAHYTRDNPQIQATAATYFRGVDRELVLAFYKHASAEIGHDQLAINDYRAVGGDAESVIDLNPLPSTSAFNGFIWHQIYHRNPVGYLGYLFFLEFLPTHAGQEIAGRLVEVGVPPNAMTFLAEHASVDVYHNRLMAQYADALIHTAEDFDDVCYVMRATAKLYGDLLLGAIQNVDRPQFYGYAHDEKRRRPLVVAGAKDRA